MLRVAQVHQRDGELIGLELLAGELCECLMDGAVHQRLHLSGASGAGRGGRVLGRSRGRRKCKNRSEDAGEAMAVIHTALLNHGWTRMNMDLNMGRLDSRIFFPLTPALSPWGEGESSPSSGH